MAELDKGKPVSLQELMLANLPQTDALTEVLIEEGRHHGREVQAEAAEERAVYQRILNPTAQ